MDAASEGALDLVGRIYDSALQPSLWPETLIRLTDVLGGTQVCFIDHDPRTLFTNLIAPRHEPGYVKSFRDEWLTPTSGNLMAERCFAAPTGQPLHLRTVISPDELTSTAFYHEWWRPQGLGMAALAIKWTHEPDAWGFCCVHRSAGADDFESRQARLFNAVAPHLVRAVELNSRLLRTGIEGAMTYAGLNRLNVGVIIADDAARIVVANDMAADLLQARDGLFVKESTVVAADNGAAARLARLIRASVSRAGHHNPGGELHVPRGSRPPLHVLVMPFPDRAAQFNLSWLGLRTRAAMLIITDPDRQRTLQTERLKRRFGLTAAEAEMAIEIARGDGREAAARRLGITVGTARTHLERIFDKTGVHRQAELARLVAETDGRSLR